MSFSRYVEDNVIDALLGTSFGVNSLWVGLFTSVPDDASSGQELGVAVVASGYARVGFNFFDTASGGFTESNTACIFPTAGAENWGTVYGVGIFDAETGGNRIAQSSLTYPVDVRSGNTVSFAPGDLSVSLD